MNYLEWIDAQINKHQTEIARLTVARSVIEEAGEAIRVNKIPKGLLPKPKPKYVRKFPHGSGASRNMVLAALATLDHAATPGEINAIVMAENKDVTAKALWNALYHLRKKGEVVREGGFYSLPKQAA